jgi:hypothetical protein
MWLLCEPAASRIRKTATLILGTGITWDESLEARRNLFHGMLTVRVPWVSSDTLAKTCFLGSGYTPAFTTVSYP